MEIHSLLYKACESVFKAIPRILAFSAAFSLGHIPAFAIITLHDLLKPLSFVEKSRLFCFAYSQFGLSLWPRSHCGFQDDHHIDEKDPRRAHLPSYLPTYLIGRSIQWDTL